MSSSNGRVSTRAGFIATAVKGVPGFRPMSPIRAGKSKKFKGTKVWMAGADTAKDAIYARLRISTPGLDYCQFPVSYNETYFRQLTSEKVRTKFVKGFPVREWYCP